MPGSASANKMKVGSSNTAAEKNWVLVFVVSVFFCLKSLSISVFSTGEYERKLPYFSEFKCLVV